MSMQSTVLIIDSDKESSIRIKNAFNLLDVESDSSLTAKEGISKLAQRIMESCFATEKSYKMILVAYDMPDMNFAKLMKKIKTTCKATPGLHPKVCCMTSGQSNEEVTSAVGDGAVTTFLPKPVSEDAIIKLY